MLVRFQQMRKNMKNNTTLIISAILAVLVAVLTIYFSERYFVKPITEKIDTITFSDTIWKDTTLTVIKEKLIPKEVYLTRVDTFFKKDGTDTIIKTERKIYQDTLCSQRDSVILKSYISGQNVMIDSIRADWKKSETIITNTVEITKYIERKKTFWNRFHIGLQAGYGYTFKSKELQPYVGIGGSFDL